MSIVSHQHHHRVQPRNGPARLCRCEKRAEASDAAAAVVAAENKMFQHLKKK